MVVDGKPMSTTLHRRLFHSVDILPGSIRNMCSQVHHWNHYSSASTNFDPLGSCSHLVPGRACNIGSCRRLLTAPSQVWPQLPRPLRLQPCAGKSAEKTRTKLIVLSDCGTCAIPFSRSMRDEKCHGGQSDGESMCRSQRPAKTVDALDGPGCTCRIGKEHWLQPMRQRASEPVAPKDADAKDWTSGKDCDQSEEVGAGQDLPG